MLNEYHEENHILLAWPEVVAYILTHKMSRIQEALLQKKKIIVSCKC